MGMETGSSGQVYPRATMGPATFVQPVRISTEPMEQLGKFYQQIYEKAGNYSRVILGIGYVGFFAAWSATKDQLSNGQRILAALLIVLSLAFYILFEVFQMLYQARWMLQLRKLVIASLCNFNRRWNAIASKKGKVQLY